MKNDELNQTPLQEQTREVAGYTEAKSFGDNKTVTEIAEYTEAKTESGKIPSVSEKSSGKSSANRILSALTTSVVALVAVVTVIAPTLEDKTVVSFDEYYATDVSLDYSLTLTNWSGNDLDVVLYNDFTNRTDVISRSDLEAEEEEADSDEAEVSSWFEEVEGEDGTTSYVYMATAQNLAPDRTYTLAVKHGTTTLGKTTLKTLSEDEYLQTEFYSVSYACACDTDGTFHFTMDFIDENNWWTDFSATLTDVNGKVASCEFTSDLLAMQTIPVMLETDDDLDGTTATFQITCTSYEFNPEGETVVLYTQQVEI